MSRITPTDWKTLQRVFEAEGLSVVRQSSSHVVMARKGMPRPVIIPKYREIGRDIITNNLRTAGISRDRYLELLGQV